MQIIKKKTTINHTCALEIILNAYTASREPFTTTPKIYYILLKRETVVFELWLSPLYPFPSSQEAQLQARAAKKTGAPFVLPALSLKLWIHHRRTRFLALFVSPLSQASCCRSSVPGRWGQQDWVYILHPAATRGESSTPGSVGRKWRGLTPLSHSLIG